MERRTYVPTGIPKDHKTKLRILTMSDDPRLNTGFGIVHKNLIQGLRELDDFAVASIGWFCPTNLETKSGFNKEDGLKIGFDDVEIIECGKSETYGINTFLKVVNYYQPNIVITIGDPWMVEQIIPIKKQYGFIWLGYTPIDGLDMPRKYVSTIRHMDKVVTYGKFGTDIALSTGIDKDDIVEISHGVDSGVFTNLDNKKQIRKELGLPEDSFIVLWNGRNTYRKRIDIMIEAFSKFISPSLCCRKCGAIYFKIHNNYELVLSSSSCERCDGKELIHNLGKNDARLFVYTTAVDCGFDVDDMVNTYELKGKIFAPTNNHVGVGISDIDMSRIYNCADVFVNTSTSEGWGMPIHEAMSCGVLSLVPDFGGYKDTLVRHAETAISYGIETLDRDSTGYIRCKPHQADLVKYLDYIYYSLKGEPIDCRWNFTENMDFSVFDKIAKNGQIAAKSLSWRLFKDKWKELVISSTPEKQIDQIHIELEEKRTILFYTDNLLPLSGGAERSAYEIAKMLTKNFNVVMAYNNLNGEHFREIGYYKNEDNIHIVEIIQGDLFIGQLLNKINPYHVITQLRASHDVAKQCINNGITYDVFVRSYEGICEAASRMSTCNYNCGSCSSFLDPDATRERIKFQFALDGARKIYANSDFTKKRTIASFKESSNMLDANKIEVIYPYVTENPDYIVSEYAERSEEYIIMFKGTESKGSLLFIKIHEYIQQNNIEELKNYKFLIVGKRDSVTNSYLLLYKGGIEVVDFIQAPSQIYAKTAMVLCPSIWREPFGRVIVESMMNNIPVLASDSGGIKEVCPPDCTITEYYDIKKWILRMRQVVSYKERFLSAQSMYLEEYKESINNQYRLFVEELNNA